MGSVCGREGDGESEDTRLPVTIVWWQRCVWWRGRGGTRAGAKAQHTPPNLMWPPRPPRPPRPAPFPPHVLTPATPPPIIHSFLRVKNSRGGLVPKDCCVARLFTARHHSSKRGGGPPRNPNRPATGIRDTPNITSVEYLCKTNRRQRFHPCIVVHHYTT